MGSVKTSNRGPKGCLYTSIPRERANAACSLFTEILDFCMEESHVSFKICCLVSMGELPRAYIYYNDCNAICALFGS